MTGTYRPRLEWLNLEWHRAMVGADAVCVQRCEGCGRRRVPPRRYCPHCWSAAAVFVPVAGGGKVVSYAISHRSLDPGWHGVVPFATLVVELDEGPRVLAATDLSPADAAIGLAVRVGVERVSEDFARIWAELSQPIPPTVV